MADGKIEIKVEVEGAAKASQDLKNVQGSTRDLGETAQRAGPKFSEMSQGIGQVSRSLGALGPEISQAGGVLQGLIGTIGSGTTSLGPFGVAIGIAAAVVGSFGREIAESKRQMDALKDSVDKINPSIDDFIGRIRTAARESARLANLRAGEGSAEELQGFMQASGSRARAAFAVANGTATSQQEDDFNTLLQERGISPSVSGDLREAYARSLAQQSVTDFRNARERARVVAAGENVTIEDGTIDFVGADAGPTMQQLQYDRPVQRPRRSGGARRGNVIDMTQAITQKRNDSRDIEDRLAEDRRRDQDEMASAIASKGNDSAEIEARQLQERRQQNQAFWREQKKQRDEYYDSWAEKGEQVGAILGDMLNLVASGQANVLQAAEQVFKQFLAQTAKSESIEAGKSFAKALGAAFVDPPAAGGFVAEGAAHLAVAAAAGGAQMIIGGHGSAGAARPTRVASPASGIGGGGTVVVNLNAPVVTAGTTRELGRTLDRVTRAGQQRFGEAA